MWPHVLAKWGGCIREGVMFMEAYVAVQCLLQKWNPAGVPVWLCDGPGPGLPGSGRLSVCGVGPGYTCRHVRPWGLPVGRWTVQINLTEILPNPMCTIYSETFLERPLPWGTTCPERPHIFWQLSHVNITEPVTRDHLSWETTFLWPIRWSFKTGSTVHVYQI